MAEPDGDRERQGLVATGLGAWARGAAARPRSALAALGLLAALSVLVAVLRLSVDTDSSRMLAPDLPFQERAHAINEAFPETKRAVVVVVRGPRADPVDRAVAEIAAGLEGAPGVASVFAPVTDPVLRRSGLLYLDREALDARLTALSKSANMIAAMREDRTLAGFLERLAEARRLAEESGTGGDALPDLYAETAAVLEAAVADETRGFAWQGALGGGAGEGETLRTVLVTPEADFSALNPVKATLASIDGAIAALPDAVAAEVETGVTGEPVLRAEELRSVARSVPVSLALSLVLVAVVLWITLGSLARTGLALGSLAATLAVTTGVAALAVGALNLVSIAFVVLMVGLGIDVAIHMLLRIAEEARGADPRAAMIRAVEALAPALVLAVATTAAAFLAFAVTDFEGMAQLGVIGAAGVVVALAVTVTAIPAAVALAPRLAVGRGRALPAAEGRVPRPAVWGALAVGAVAAVIATEARFDADPMSLRDPTAESVRVQGWLAADPTRQPLRLSLLEPSAETAEAAAERVEALPEVHAAVWLGDLVPDDQDAKLMLIDLGWPSIDQAVNGEPVRLVTDLPDRDGLAAILAESPHPEGRRLADALEALDDAPGAEARAEEALFRYFPDLIAVLRDQLDVGPLAAADLPDALRRRYVAEDGIHRVEILAEGDMTDPVVRGETVAAVRAVAPGAGGPPDQIEGASSAVAAAMVKATATALVACAALALLVVRSLATMGAILLPVALAGAVTAAAGVLTGIPFNYANVIVLPLLIGIGVDSGVHMALRAREGAVLSTATPRAVTASALTTVVAFATLALSPHRGTASMGMMLAIALVAAVAMTLILTPALMPARQSRHGTERRET